MRWTRAVTAAVMTTSILVGPAATSGVAQENAVHRIVGVGGGASWDWHKVSHLPDGTRTFRTAYLVAALADVRQGGDEWQSDTIYARVDDYTYRGDNSFVAGVKRLYAGTRDSLTWTVAPDYSWARVTGTMVETSCHGWYEDCVETGTVAFDVRFEAANLQVYTDETFRPTRYSGSFSHFYSGATTYQTPATGEIAGMPLPRTYAASYSAFDALGKLNCRNTCELYETAG